MNRKEKREDERRFMKSDVQKKKSQRKTKLNAACVGVTKKESKIVFLNTNLTPKVKGE